MTNTLPALDIPPDHWETATFTAKQGETVRYGWTPIPEGETRKGIIVLLEGRSEFLEKFYELIRDFEKEGYACATFDWPSQGHSSRYAYPGPATNIPHYIPSFDRLVDVLGEFHDEILPGCFAGHEDIPRILFGHSMGGHLGLRYLADHPKDFSCAGFTAPMVGIRLPTPSFLDQLLLKYYPRKDDDFHPGGGNWDYKTYSIGMRVLSSDARRVQYHRDQFAENPELQVGSWDMSTLREAYRSTQILQKQTIETPTIVFPAAKDLLVRSSATKAFAAAQPDMTVVSIPGSLHEIYMECDRIRNVFLRDFLQFVDHNTP